MCGNWRGRMPGRLFRAVAVAILAAMVMVGCDGDTSGVPTASSPASSPPTIAPTATPGMEEPAAETPASAATPAAVDAANAFLDALTSEQRSTALYDLDSPLRPNWSNLPAGILRFERNGVRIGDLDAEQTELMHRFLKLALSADGYSTVVEVVGAEEILAASPGAARLRWSADNYWLAFFGEPSAVNHWGWQFGGHHLAVNVTVVDGRSYLSPTLVGIEPASYEVNGSIVAPLAAEVESGLKLINSLDDDRRVAARVNDRPNELWTGAGNDGIVPPLEGSSVSEWSESQQALLMDVVALWVGLLPEDSAHDRLAEVRADLGETYFAWHGNADGNGPIYYRIQGPKLIIEFSTQGNVGGDAGHFHSVYRDPTNEYGVAAANAN